MIQQNLNRNATETLSSRFLTTVEGYFSPLFQFMSTASLWTRIGDLDSIGEPEQYIESLYESLDILGTASALSLVDSDDRELVMMLDSEGGYQWYETVSGAEDSLVDQRNEQGVEYLNLSDVGEYSTLYGEYPAWFRFSLSYDLVGEEGYGFTIRTTLGGRESDRAMKIWIDLPSDRFAVSAQSAGIPDDAVIFLLLPGDDLLLFSARELNAIAAEGGQAVSPITGRPDEGFITQVLENSDFVDLSRTDEARFEYGGQQWRASSMDAKIGSQEIKLGVFVPVDSLWTTDLYLPAQLLVAFILFSVVSLFYFLIRDYRRNATALNEGELLRILIDRGESASLEFKSSLRWDFRQEKVNKDLEGVIMKSVAAFSNTAGGTLLIGVDDSGQVLGLEKDYSSLKDHGRDYFELHLRTLLIAQYGTDAATRGVAVTFVALEGMDVCRLDISRGKKPLYTTLASKSGAPSEKFFVRSGNSSRAVDSLAEITSYVVDRFGRRAVE